MFFLFQFLTRQQEIPSAPCIIPNLISCQQQTCQAANRFSSSGGKTGENPLVQSSGELLSGTCSLLTRSDHPSIPSLLRITCNHGVLCECFPHALFFDILLSKLIWAGRSSFQEWIITSQSSAIFSLFYFR